MAGLALLLGFMGSGKTACGTRAATLLGWRFLDLDEEVSRRAGRPIEDIFRQEGERTFREMESAVLSDLLREGSGGEAGLVLSLGGGAVAQAPVRRLLEGRGIKIWLRVDPAVAWERVAGSGRPLARQRKEFVQLAGAREPVYRAVADVSLDTSAQSEEQVASRIAQVVSAAAGQGAQPEQPWRLEVRGGISTSLILGGAGARQACEEAGREVAESGRRLRLASDENVTRSWPGVVRRMGSLFAEESGRQPVFVTPPGEEAKSLTWAEQGWRWLAQAQTRRDDVVLAFGGGVVGDLAGFLAATYLRGLELWQLPTSLLAQVDSSVGGKVAVNLEQGKNLVGAFYQPAKVFIDPGLLLTLPRTEVVNGLGEVVKYGLLGGEPLLTELEERAEDILNLEPGAVDAMVRQCVRYKAEVVQRDERESGERAVLNLGHTTAHALERVLGYGQIGHGLAVALGTLVALRLSEELAGCPTELRFRARELMRRWELPARLPLPSAAEIIAAMKWDKKSRAGGIGFVLVESAGSPLIGMPVPEETLLRAIEEIRA